MRGFQDDVGAGLVDLRCQTAHDTGQGHRTAIVGDDDIGRIEVALHMVEGFQGLTGRRRADLDRTLQFVRVERVQWLPEFEHDVVRDVHG